MFHVRMAEAIAEAHTLSRLDELSRQVWQALGAEAVDDSQASRLAEQVEARRKTVRGEIRPVGIPAGRPSLFPPKRYQRSPDRVESRERRRLLACLGPLPSQLAARFTEGQRAVLKIVGDEVRANGLCALCVDAIAARAGVCRRLAQAALRLAAGDGLLTIEERRREGRKNETNLVRIISREWLAWLRRGRAAPPLPSPGSSAPAVSTGIGCNPILPTGEGVKSGDSKRGRTKRRGFATSLPGGEQRSRAARGGGARI